MTAPSITSANDATPEVIDSVDVACSISEEYCSENAFSIPSKADTSDCDDAVVPTPKIDSTDPEISFKDDNAEYAPADASAGAAASVSLTAVTSCADSVSEPTPISAIYPDTHPSERDESLATAASMLDAISVVVATPCSMAATASDSAEYATKPADDISCPTP